MERMDKDFYDDMLKLCVGAVYKCRGEDREITYAAGATEALAGFEPEDMTGRCLNDLVHGLNIKKTREVIAAAGDGGIYAAEYRLVRETGSPVWVSDRGRRYVRDGVVMTEGILTDVTAVHRIRTGREKFVRNVNREVRTPMSSVIGFLELALDTLDDDDVIGGYLLMARQSAVSMLNMLNDITYISRQPDGAARGGTFCLRIMLEEITAFLSSKNQDNGVSVTLDYPSDIPECFYGDAKRLRRILSVIIENSIIRTLTYVDVSVAYVDGTVAVRVRDRGERLDKRTLKEFFMPGHGAKDSDRNIRMAVAGVLASQMDGSLRADNTDDGNVLTLIVPLKPQQCEGGCGGICGGMEYNPESLRDISRGLSVLLAEDVEENADLALFRLRRRGHRVDVAANGAEAVRLFTENSYDVVLLDLHMPLMDGVKALKTIRSMNRGRHVPVIGMTSSPMPRDRQSALEAGMDAVFIKPIDFSALFEKMEQLVPPDAGFNANIIACVGGGSIDFAPLDGYINTEDAVRIWGSDVMFVSAMSDFADKHGKCCDAISALMETGLKEAARYVHRLKNITASFSCEPLKSKLADVESWLAAGDREVAEMMLGDLREEMEIFVERVRGLQI